MKLTDIEISRVNERKIYLSSVKDMYLDAIYQNGELYDIAAKLTDNFKNISGQSILSDSRIIKILRYAVVPSISQMKFGQFFDLKSINKFENDKVVPGTSKYKALENLADKIAKFATVNLDSTRFIWLTKNNADKELGVAKEYAKKWTCSLMADQNAQTKYRNWRKEQQEEAIAAELVNLGYTKSSYVGIIRQDSDITIGEYTQELRVEGRTRQKADVIVRSKKTKRLLLIEAKAVGVELDSVKRIKECCDKANDWSTSKKLNSPIIVTVIAGYFNDKGINNLEASGIKVVWEHRLKDLKKYL